MGYCSTSNTENADDSLWRILVSDSRRVPHVEHLGGVLARGSQDRELAARVLAQTLVDVQDLTM
jgi:hypothetical protein